MESPSRFSALLSELKSRHVSRVAITYVAIAFAGLQGADLVLSPLGAESAYRWILLATLIGFPIALLLAWFFDVRRTPPVVAQSAESTRVPFEPLRRTGRLRLPAIAVVALAGLGLYGYRTLAPRGNVTTAAEVIAVAPFSAVGGEASELGEGMARLLSANLDQVGGLRALDPTRVLRAWRGSAQRPSEEEALALARKLGAGSVLIGNVVEAGKDVRLTASLKSVAGKEIARAQVTGYAGDVLLLVDTLSNRLLREIWRARSPVPQLRIAAITTSNLDAIRAYLDGERYYRQLQWDSAIAALQRAVEADPTFALAHRRLSDVYGWSNYDSPVRRLHDSAAAANIGRLPERERLIASAFAHWHKGDYQVALDSIDAHLRVYRDDADALNLRAEVLYHGDMSRAWKQDPQALKTAFEAALRADPELAPAMLHPLDLSAELNDTTGFRRYARKIMRARGLPEPSIEPTVDSIVDILWRGQPYGSLMHRLQTGKAAGLPQVWPAFILIRARRDPQPVVDSMLAYLDSATQLELMSLATLTMGTGRMRDLTTVMRRIDAELPVISWQMRATAVAMGIAPGSFSRRVWPKAEIPLPPRGRRGRASRQADGMQPSWLAPAQAMLDLSAGDTAAEARALRAMAGVKLPPGIDALRRSGEGRLAIARGDAARGVRILEAATKDALSAGPHPAGPPTIFYEVILAIEHASHPPTRRSGIEETRALLESYGINSPFGPLLHFHLARALEAEGEREAAVREYGWFLTLTSRAEGRLAGLHREAQAALARLAPRG